MITGVIKKLIASPEELAQALAALENDDLQSAIDAGQNAIEALEAERCNRLFVSEVAVLIDRGHRQTVGLMKTSFREDKKHKQGKDYHWVAAEKVKQIASISASQRGGNRLSFYQYRRDSINSWWSHYEDAKTKNARKIAAESVAVQRAILQKQITALQKKLENLNALNRSTFAFLVDAHDQIMDNLALPLRDSQEIASRIQAGGRIEHLSLTEAISEWGWTSDGAYEPWAWVWSTRIEEEKERLDALLISAGAAHANGREIALARRAPAATEAEGKERKRS